MTDISKRTWDVVVTGGGHAGIEAALAAARMGSNTLLVTLDPNAIGRMSCNPAIGGLAKGHLTREIDALGGEMGLATDKNVLQFKTLNTRKGRAVWSPRAQVDKRTYPKYLQATLNNQPKLTVLTGEVTGIKTNHQRLTHIIINRTAEIKVRAAILTCGTFMNGLIHIGERKFQAGRIGERPALGLTESLAALGFRTGRLKTGTPPRLHRDSINWDRVQATFGDEHPQPFSFRTPEPLLHPNIPCHITHTDKQVRDLILDNLHRAPLYTGAIKGIGPRYCPSIEDKVVRFAHRERHQLFLEPEWLDSHQIYVNGFSTSLPEDIQKAALHTVPGLERAALIRPGYAIEYDFLPPSQLKATLETKDIAGLFCAGQINGTSGYEEAGGQGLLAGINAVAYLSDLDSLVLHRDEAYIGVMIDDLITKDTDEPYRMFTSRAEYRLLLRADNADMRLSSYGLEYGLLNDADAKRLEQRQKTIQLTKDLCDAISVEVSGNSPATASVPANLPTVRMTFTQYLKRPHTSIHDTVPGVNGVFSAFAPQDLFTAETDLKYAGYIHRQENLAAAMRRMDDTPIAPEFDVMTIAAMRTEARQKLNSMRPQTLGQASRLSGVNPPDIALLSLHLKRWHVSRETMP